MNKNRQITLLLLLFSLLFFASPSGAHYRKPRKIIKRVLKNRPERANTIRFKLSGAIETMKRMILIIKKKRSRQEDTLYEYKLLKSKYEQLRNIYNEYLFDGRLSD